jgi:TatD DNase family protein
LNGLKSWPAQKLFLLLVRPGLIFIVIYHRGKIQEEVFREHLRLACRLNKPVIIHSRQAHAETLKILKDEDLPSPAGVMHCFSGDRHWAEAFLDLGFYISIAGPVTYPRSHDLRDLLPLIPALTGCCWRPMLHTCRRRLIAASATNHHYQAYLRAGSPCP